MTSSLVAMPDTMMKACPDDILTANLEEKPVFEEKETDK